MNEFLKETVAWFLKEKGLLLEPEIDAGIFRLLSGEELDGLYKKLFGFMLFSYCMHTGPWNFKKAEACAAEIGVLEEMEYYAKDWLKNGKKKTS